MADEGDAIVKGAGCCVALGVAVFLAGAVWGWLGDDSEVGPPLYDYSAQSACQTWAGAMREANQGVSTDTEIRVQLRDMLDPAERSSHVGLGDATVELVAAFTASDTDRITAANNQVADLCLPVLQWVADQP